MIFDVFERVLAVSGVLAAKIFRGRVICDGEFCKDRRIVWNVEPVSLQRVYFVVSEISMGEK